MTRRWRLVVRDFGLVDAVTDEESPFPRPEIFWGVDTSYREVHRATLGGVWEATDRIAGAPHLATEYACAYGRGAE